MSVHHKDDCPCGSGKRYKHCHLPADEARRKKATFGGIAVVGALVVGTAAFGVISQWNANRPPAAGVLADSSAFPPGAAGGDVSGVPAPANPGAFGIVQPGASGRPPIPQTGSGMSIPVRSTSAALAPGENPTPWEYDVQKNRHYDPREGHQHWHNGPPPADTTQAVVVAPRQIKLDEKGNVISETSARVAGTTAATPVTGPTPKDWEYDQAKNQHYDPTHGHWHSGPPPAGK